MEKKHQQQPICPQCGKAMRFTQLIPAIGGLPELYSYYCDFCGESDTQVGDHGERRRVLS